MQVNLRGVVSAAVVGVATMLTLSACDKREPEQGTLAPREGLQAPASAPAPAAEEQSTPTPSTLMKQHFSKAGEMKAAVVRGDIAAFREAAEVLATRQSIGDVAPAWKAHLQAMQNAAGVGRDAMDIV